MLITLIEWMGAISSIAGSYFLAKNDRNSGYGWLFFFIGNVCMITFAIINLYFGILLMNCVFMITTCIGINNWFDINMSNFRLKFTLKR